MISIWIQKIYSLVNLKLFLAKRAYLSQANGPSGTTK